MFIQIHTLTGYAGVLLNRDDTGMAKRLEYGDAVRTRVSSQSVKRKIRLADGEFSISAILENSVRSRETFKRKIAQPLIDSGLDADAVVAVTLLLMDAVYKTSGKAKKDRMEEMVRIEKGEIGAISLLERGEINVLAGAEIEYLKGLVQGFVTGHSKVDAEKAAAVAVADKEFKKNLKAIGTASSLDVAMFGRMVTGDALSSVDAAVHVAHAITTHGQQVETDFFTAVDDLVTGDADNGGGHLGEVEITSPLLYGYYVVDWKQLMTNLAGIDNPVEVGAKLVKNLIRLVAENVVGAKKGSTAPYSSADLVLVEIGIGQPRTLAEAFRKTAKPTLEAAVISLTDHLNGKDRMYGTTAERFVASTLKTDPALGIAQPLPAVAEAVGAKLATAA